MDAVTLVRHPRSAKIVTSRRMAVKQSYQDLNFKTIKKNQKKKTHQYTACKSADLCHAAGEWPRSYTLAQHHQNATAYGNVVPVVQTAEPSPPTGS